MNRVDFEELDITDDLAMTWHGELFTGVAYELTLEGKLLCEVSYVNGMREGIAREWYPSGQLWEEENYATRSGNGFSREWFENGQLKRESEYESGILIMERDWDEQGTLTRDFQITEESPNFRLLSLRRRRNS